MLKINWSGKFSSFGNPIVSLNVTDRMIQIFSNMLSVVSDLNINAKTNAKCPA